MARALFGIKTGKFFPKSLAMRVDKSWIINNVKKLQRCCHSSLELAEHFVAT
jgi:hypothetical protein